MSARSAERKPLTRRPKVGQRVLLRRRYHGARPEGQEYYWERGTVEIVRKDEVVFRSRTGSYELTVPLADLFELPRHWGRR